MHSAMTYLPPIVSAESARRQGSGSKGGAVAAERTPTRSLRVDRGPGTEEGPGGTRCAGAEQRTLSRRDLASPCPQATIRYAAAHLGRLRARRYVLDHSAQKTNTQPASLSDPL
jgi:hypothetical protein